MDAAALVYADIDSTPILIGRLWTRLRNGRESATFEYDRSWLVHPSRFSLEPSLQLFPGPYHTGADMPMFGAIGDSAPDRWGRVLMRRAERRRAQLASETLRSLREIDYLLLVDDESRQGALRFSLKEKGPFQAPSRKSSVPPLLQLSRLLSAADHLLAAETSGEQADEDLRLLLVPGSSLGGARPKASVRDRDGSLAVAKFPHRADLIDTISWEAVALSLAAKAGIRTPQWRLENVGGRNVLLLRRFDRDGKRTRIPFLSAMSMLNARDNESHSYIEIADALVMHGVEPNLDLAELWRRLVFNILVSNTDDHLRNHGFLYTGTGGWKLAPAYDLNPVPVDMKPRVLSTAIDLDDATASLPRAFEVSGHFRLDNANARRIAREVGNAVASWRTQAIRFGLSLSDCDRMASAFEHDDLKLARSTRRTLAAG